MKPSKKQKVLASVLNWNNYSITLRCINSLLKVIKPDHFDLEILVIDNGSDPSDFEQLEFYLLDKPIKLVRNKENLGFADGHNYAIKQAIDFDCSRIWLVNNDSIVNENVLLDCLNVFSSQERVGAVTPCLAYEDDPSDIYFSGSKHNWKSLTLDSSDFEGAASGSSSWIWATVAIYSIDAIREIGLLEGKYFAYYEDNDISERLRKANWLTKVCKNNISLHSKKAEIKNIRHDYYYYLNCRNYQLFFQKHTPIEYRKNLRVRLLSRAMIQVARLREAGAVAAADAALTGCVDGFLGKHGAPKITKKTNYIGEFLFGLWTLKNKFDIAR